MREIEVAALLHAKAKCLNLPVYDFLASGQQWTGKPLIRRDLRRNRDRCELAYWHHPHFTGGPHVPDEE